MTRQQCCKGCQGPVLRAIQVSAGTTPQKKQGTACLEASVVAASRLAQHAPAAQGPGLHCTLPCLSTACRLVAHLRPPSVQRFGRVGKRQAAKAAAEGEPEADGGSTGRKVRLR